uniref:Ribosomal protein L14 n=1 Tax=Proteromonas lacertae TaxID=42746 RepID=E2E9Z5_PROLC|nr:ribosomal protein L14 [Proteromonas lacertae]YP_003795232.1 ribosomal protein L14 [Proteromonas lacertae]ADD46350.1 ribosomal protein L14 [Proteromonas lacertae]ADD46370.1 ribosomal protein L14 [Proteromonas lacertae]
MIQMNTILKVADNSGAKTVFCFKFPNKLKHNATFFNEKAKVSIRSLRKRGSLKIKKGDIYTALVLRQKINLRRFNGSFIKFSNNSVILFDPKKDNTPLGTRIFGIVNKELRLKKYLKIISLASCLI